MVVLRTSIKTSNEIGIVSVKHKRTGAEPALRDFEAMRR